VDGLGVRSFSEWLTNGKPFRIGMEFDNITLLVQAAISGHGLRLGWFAAFG